jgi:hypothetical protein
MGFDIHIDNLTGTQFKIIKKKKKKKPYPAINFEKNQ